MPPEKKPENEDFANHHINLALIKANATKLVELFEVISGNYDIYSKQLKIRFNSLVKAGFSEAQALKIVAEQGIVPK